MSWINDWLAPSVAAISGAILIWVAVSWIGETGRLAYVLGYLGTTFVLAIGLRWIYTRVRRGKPRRQVWSPWLLPLTLVVLWIARS
jgi:hypothetical protein